MTNSCDECRGERGDFTGAPCSTCNDTWRDRVALALVDVAAWRWLPWRIRMWLAVCAARVLGP